MPRFAPDPPVPAVGGIRRLLPWFGLALLLHVCLLTLLRPPPGGASARPTGLELFLKAAPTRSPTPAAPMETVRAEPAVPKAGGGGKANATAVLPAVTTAPAVAPPEAATESASPSSAVAGSLLESARRQIREESRLRARSLPIGPVAAAQAAGENPLARALKAPVAGERHFADGLMKITRPDGGVYCVLKPRDFQRSDFDNAVATTTCP